jgi:hypothetical protein
MKTSLRLKWKISLSSCFLLHFQTLIVNEIKLRERKWLETVSTRRKDNKFAEFFDTQRTRNNELFNLRKGSHFSLQQFSTQLLSHAPHFCSIITIFWIFVKSCLTYGTDRGEERRKFLKSHAERAKRKSKINLMSQRMIIINTKSFP